MNVQKAPSWGERIFGILAGSIFAGFFVCIFADTHKVDTLILATRHSLFGW